MPDICQVARDDPPETISHRFTPSDELALLIRVTNGCFEGEALRTDQTINLSNGFFNPIRLKIKPKMLKIYTKTPHFWGYFFYLKSCKISLDIAAVLFLNIFLENILYKGATPTRLLCNLIFFHFFIMGIIMQIILIETNLKVDEIGKKQIKEILKEISKKYNGLYIQENTSGYRIIIANPQPYDASEIINDINALLKKINKDLSVSQAFFVSSMPNGVKSFFEIMREDFNAIVAASKPSVPMHVSWCETRLKNITARFDDLIRKSEEDGLSRHARYTSNLSPEDILAELRLSNHSRAKIESHLESSYPEHKSLQHTPTFTPATFEGFSLRNKANDHHVSSHLGHHAMSGFLELTDPLREMRLPRFSAFNDGRDPSQNILEMEQERRRQAAEQNERLLREQQLERQKVAEQREQEFQRQKKLIEQDRMMLAEMEKRRDARVAAENEALIARFTQTQAIKSGIEELELRKTIECEKTLTAFFKAIEIQSEAKVGDDQLKTLAFVNLLVTKAPISQETLAELRETDGVVKLILTRITSNQDDHVKTMRLFLHEVNKMLGISFDCRFELKIGGIVLYLPLLVPSGLRNDFVKHLQNALFIVGIESIYQLVKIIHLVKVTPSAITSDTTHQSPLGNKLPKKLNKDPEPSQDSIDVEKLLSKYRNSKETNNPEPNVAFRRAAVVGNIEDVRTFIDHFNVDINSKSSNGKTARDWASEKGHTSIVKLIDERCEHKSTSCKKIILGFKRSHGRANGNISTADAIKVMLSKIQELPLCKKYNIKLEGILENESNTNFTINLLGLSIADDDKASQKNLKQQLLDIFYAAKVGELYLQDEFIMKKIVSNQNGVGQVITVSPPTNAPELEMQATVEGARQVATLSV